MAALSALSALLMLILGIVVKGDDSTQCERIFLQGLQINSFPLAQHFEGVYSFSKEYGVFVHETRFLYYFFDNKNKYYWIDHFTDKNVALQNVALRKHVNSDTWEYYDPNHGHQFLPVNGNLSFSCAAQTMHQCSTGVYRFEAPHSAMPRRVRGEEFKVAKGEYLNSGPVLKTLSGLVMNYDGKGAWQVAQSSNPMAPFLTTDSSVLDPGYISTHWVELTLRKGEGEPERKLVEGLGFTCQSQIKDGKKCLDHNPCKNDAACLQYEHRAEHRKYCLCPQGFTGANCTEQLPSCPAPPSFTSIPGTDNDYFSFSKDSRFFMGDSVAYSCAPSNDNTDDPKHEKRDLQVGGEAPQQQRHHYVRSTCQAEAHGEVKWSDVTCSKKPNIVPEPLTAPDNQSIIIGGVVCGVCFVVVGLLVGSVVFFRYRRRQQNGHVPANNSFDDATASKTPLARQSSSSV